jgi:hypothetical protein
MSCWTPLEGENGTMKSVRPRCISLSPLLCPRANHEAVDRRDWRRATRGSRVRDLSSLTWLRC